MAPNYLINIIQIYAINEELFMKKGNYTSFIFLYL